MMVQGETRAREFLAVEEANPNDTEESGVMSPIKS